MIYLVTGMARSGTSAMMRALIMGGMVGNYFAPLDVVMAQADKLKRPNYDPNPYGFFEQGFTPAVEAHGMVSKIMLNRFDGAIVDKLTVVVMHRSEAERKASLDEWDFATDEFLLGFDEHYADFKSRHQGANIVDVQYSQLINNPEQELVRLQQAGWPIDPRKGARAIDPTLYRHRSRLG